MAIIIKQNMYTLNSYCSHDGKEQEEESLILPRTQNEMFCPSHLFTTNIYNMKPNSYNQKLTQQSTISETGYLTCLFTLSLYIL